MRYCLTLVLVALFALGGAHGQQNADPRVPEPVRKKIIYRSGEEQKGRCMVVIAHHHGDSLFSSDEDIPYWIAHQNEILDILLEFAKHHDSGKVRFFFEGEKGPYAKWPANTRAIAPRNHQAFQEWKVADAEKKKAIAAEFTKELGKATLDKGPEIWSRYHPSLGLVSHNKEKKLDAVIFGSEPPKKVPIMPDFELLGKERHDVFRRRSEKIVMANIHERNRYASLVMKETVPVGGVGVLLMGAAHNSSVYERYSKLLHYKVSGEFGLEAHLAKIGDVTVVVIEPTTLKNLMKKRGID